MARRAPRKNRGAYTVLDALAVVGICGLALALLCPAILQARLATSRDVCQNNLRVLGEAFLTFERTHGGFPPRRTGFSGTKGYGGWGSQLLPLLDEKLGGEFHSDYDFYDPINKTVVETKIATFICPAAPPDRTCLIRSNASGSSSNIDKTTLFEAHCGPNDYISSNGFFMPKTGYGVNWPTDANGNQHQAMTDNDNLPVSRITDGLSQTLLIVEKAGAPQIWRAGKRLDQPDLFAGQNNSRGAWAGYGSIAFGPSDSTGEYRQARGDSTDCSVNCNNTFGIYSFHEDGANVILCDGSVRFVNKTLDGLTFGRLTTRDDGQFIAADAY